jgi:hypothetical protein
MQMLPTVQRRPSRPQQLWLCAVAIGLAGVLAPTAAASGLSWSTPSSIDTQPLFAVSCPSTSLCVATDLNGNVLTSTNPTGGATAWTLASADPGEPLGPPSDLRSVSCPYSTLCVAVDGRGNVVTSTDPTGGASAWTVTNVDSGNGLSSVSCPLLDISFPQYCVAVDFAGNVVYTTGNPTGGASAWATAHIDTPEAFFTSVSCADFSSMCAAVDGNGNVLTSTEPTGGAGAWSAPVGIAAFANEPREPLEGISCPTIHFCAATDGYDYIDYEGYSRGDVITSTNPTGGAKAWSEPTQLALGLFAISCRSSEFCAAADLSGNVFASTEPPGNIGAWSNEHVDASKGLVSDITGLSCPSTTLCVAVDAQGNVLTGTPATEENEPEPEPKEEHTAGGGGGGKTGGGGNPPPVTIPFPPVEPPDRGPAPLTPAQLAALLSKQLVPSGKASKIGALLKHGGLSLIVQGLGAGTLTVQWYVVPPGAKLAKQSKAKPVLVASGKLTLAGTGTGKLKLQPTAAGRRLLKHARRIKIVAKGVFVASGGAAVSATGATVLRH